MFYFTHCLLVQSAGAIEYTDLWVECSPMARETGVQSQVELYQRLEK